LNSCGTDRDEIDPGEVAKDFRLDTLTHERFYLNQHKDKVVVLVFWTTWCNVCKAELVELRSLKNKNTVVAGICSDPEDVNEVKRLANSLNIDYPVLLDEGQVVTDKYRVSTFPTTVIINQKGVVSFVKKGYNATIAHQIKTKVASLFVSNESVE
jgi:peroxiredoxin